MATEKKTTAKKTTAKKAACKKTACKKTTKAATVKHIGLVKNDPYLADYEDAIRGRHDHVLWKMGQLTNNGKTTLSDFANGFEYFGLHKTEKGWAASYTPLRAHETGRNLVCRLLLEKKKHRSFVNTHCTP